MTGWRVETRLVNGRPGGLCQHPRRRFPCKARLAHALGTGEQPGMVKPPGLPCGGELLDRLVLPGDHGSKSPVA